MYNMDYKYVSIFSNIGRTLNMYIFRDKNDDREFFVTSFVVGDEPMTYIIRNEFGFELMEDIIENALDALFRESSYLTSVNVGAYSFSVDKYPTKRVCFTFEPLGKSNYIEVDHAIINPEDLVCAAIEMVYSETSPFSFDTGPNKIPYKHQEQGSD